MLLLIPPELHTTLLTYLRATDLSSLQQTCTTFSNRTLIQNVISTFATQIYPPELTKGYDTPAISGAIPFIMEEKPTFELLRNMEMLIVARVLSRPEPPLSERGNSFYVSKAWCKAALKWLEVQEEQRKERYKLKIEAAKAAGVGGGGSSNNNRGKKKHHQHGSGSKKGKKGKKVTRQERMRNRKLSDTSPPWPNVNHDIICEHGGLKQSCSNNGGGNSNSGANTNNDGSSRSARAKRRLLDKQAWKVLKRLYPEGIQLSTLQGECIQCAMEFEAKKRNEEMRRQKETEERRMPLENEYVRKFYNRTRGVPKECLIIPEGEYENSFNKMSPLGKKGLSCPLVSGVYYVLPRSWCHAWRKYMKSGEGTRPCAPETSLCLCDAHRLPLIPPHLEAYLYGDTSSLLGTSCDLMPITDINNDSANIGEIPLQATVGLSSSSTMNIRTIHDLISPQQNLSTATSAASSGVYSPRPLPVGYYPIDQRLGGRSRSNSHSSMIDTSQHSLGRSRSNSLLQNNTPFPQSTHQPDEELISTLRASGLSEAEIQLQRFAIIQIEEQRIREQQRMEEVEAERRRQQQAINLMSPEDIRSNLNAKLDRENRVVVEILTREEYNALEGCWPEIHSSYALKFVITENGGGIRGEKDIVWTTPPCRACDASGSNHEFVVRNRCRNWVNATPKKKKTK